MKIGRAVLWIALIFFVFRGVASAFKPNSTDEANQLITEFRAGFDDYREVDTEILAFAQNFARQYMTYEVKGEKDYKQRLAQYVASEVLDMNFSFGSSAKVIYAEAYRREEYSDNQSDVYVLLDVEYPEGQENQENTESHTVIIKVPVFAVGKKYIVEDLPCFVSDELKVESYASQPHSGTEVTPQEREDIRQSLTNFFQSYYESGTDVINYYLSKDADRSKFLGLDKRLLFGGIDSVKSYLHLDGLVRSIVTVNVIDVNGVKMPQRYNLILEKMDGKYYIRSMDARSVNVKKEVVSYEKAEGDV